jgi:hypothetical protein
MIATANSLAERRLRLVEQIADARVQTRLAAGEAARALQKMKSTAFVGQQAFNLLKPLVMTAGVAWVLKKPAGSDRPRGRMAVALVGLVSLIRAVQRINSVLVPVLRLLGSAGR